MVKIYRDLWSYNFAKFTAFVNIRLIFSDNYNIVLFFCMHRSIEHSVSFYFVPSGYDRLLFFMYSIYPAYMKKKIHLYSLVACVLSFPSFSGLVNYFSSTLTCELLLLFTFQILRCWGRPTIQTSYGRFMASRPLRGDFWRSDRSASFDCSGYKW